MTHPLWIFNVLLALVGLGLAAVLLSSLADRPSLEPARQPAPVVAGPSAGPTPVKSPALQPASARRPLSEFDIILERNLFKNLQAPVEQKRAEPPPAPAGPLPVLMGTIFVGEKAEAILKERDRQDVYSVGDSVAGGRLTKIEEGRVVIERGNRSAEISLKSSLKPIAPPVKSRAAGVATSKAAATDSGPGPEQHPAEWVSSSRALRMERLRRSMGIIGARPGRGSQAR